MHGTWHYLPVTGPVVNEAIAGTHATLWSFDHTFTLTCVRTVVIVGCSPLDVYSSHFRLLLHRYTTEIGQFMSEDERSGAFL